jgi:tRNA 2-thiouridine synthesizing protein E
MRKTLGRRSQAASGKRGNDFAQESFGMATALNMDEAGFLQQSELWNEELAAALANSDGISELTDRHWKVIRYIREYYLEFQSAPTNGKLCKETGCSLREIYALFPSGPTKGACRIAGLPKPASCVG